MSKQEVFSLSLEPSLRAQFIAASQAAHRPAEQILRELMREFVQRQSETADYDAFVQSKLDAARQCYQEGKVISGEDVEAEFAQRRAQATTAK